MLSPRKLHPVLRAERAEKDRFATGQKNYSKKQAKGNEKESDKPTELDDDDTDEEEE